MVAQAWSNNNKNRDISTTGQRGIDRYNSNTYKILTAIDVLNRTINQFQANRLVETSKLVLYPLTYLIWCPYIII